MMKGIRLSLSLVMIITALSSCEKMAIDNTYGNALIIKHEGNISMVYPIRSVFQGVLNLGFDSYSFRIFFYQDYYPAGPNSNDDEALVEIHSKLRSRDESETLEELIDQIVINDVDNSLGLGTRLEIPMNKGIYEGKHEQIKEVSVKSFKLATYTDRNNYKQKKDSDIYIVIKTNVGDVVTIRFAHKETPWDSYYLPISG